MVDKKMTALPIHSPQNTLLQTNTNQSKFTTMSSHTRYRTRRTTRHNRNRNSSFRQLGLGRQCVDNRHRITSLSFRKALCSAAYAYHRRRKAHQIKEYIRKTHSRCVSALRDLTACHLDNKKDVILRAEMKYEKAVAAHGRCGDLISQCSTKYHSEIDREWLRNSIQLHAGYTVALQYVRCIVFDKLMPVQRAYYAVKGLKFMKLYRNML